MELDGVFSGDNTAEHADGARGTYLLFTYGHPFTLLAALLSPETKNKTKQAKTNKQTNKQKLSNQQTKSTQKIGKHTNKNKVLIRGGTSPPDSVVTFFFHFWAPYI